MKVVILAGGLGTRLAEETNIRPKPMIEIGGRPLLWHIMKIYSRFGYNDFVICLGYLGYVIKEYFSNYALHNSDVTYDFRTGEVTMANAGTEGWRVSLIETGADTMTGGRLQRIRHLLGAESFMMTYGDGVADVDLAALHKLHKSHGRLATVTAVQPPGRFGVLELDRDDRVTAFREKPQDEVGWINGGFFVLEPAALDLIENDATIWEREPLEQLVARDQLRAHRHRGFWQPVDTLRDKRYLEELWVGQTAPWKTWP